MAAAAAPPEAKGGTVSGEFVLSVQSHVAFGYVGNSAAVPVLQAGGIECVAVHTVSFSNHPAHSTWSGTVHPPAHVQGVLASLRSLGIFPHCRAVLSGYLGDAGNIPHLLAAVADVRAQRPDALYLCDPVMGDVGCGVFVNAAIPAAMRSALAPAADVLTPNHFELELLAGAPCPSRAASVAAARALPRGGAVAEGARVVVVTSLRTADVPADAIETLVVTATAAWTVRTPYLADVAQVSGSGDTFAAILLSHLLAAPPAPTPGDGPAWASPAVLRAAVSRATSALHSVLAALPPGARDCNVVAHHRAVASPPHLFPALPVRADGSVDEGAGG